MSIQALTRKVKSEVSRYGFWRKTSTAKSKGSVSGYIMSYVDETSKPGAIGESSRVGYAEYQHGKGTPQELGIDYLSKEEQGRIRVFGFLRDAAAKLLDKPPHLADPHTGQTTRDALGGKRDPARRCSRADHGVAGQHVVGDKNGVLVGGAFGGVGATHSLGGGGRTHRTWGGFPWRAYPAACSPRCRRPLRLCFSGSGFAPMTVVLPHFMITTKDPSIDLPRLRDNVAKQRAELARCEAVLQESENTQLRELHRQFNLPDTHALIARLESVAGPATAGTVVPAATKLAVRADIAAGLPNDAIIRKHGIPIRTVSGIRSFLNRTKSP